MKLDQECIRDVLLFLEEKCDFLSLDAENDISWEPVFLEKICEALPKYSKKTIFYTIFNLYDVGFLDCTIRYSSDIVAFCAVNHMTFSGHEFLDRIRDNRRWTAAKKALSAIRDYSLDALNAVAQGMTSAAIDAYFKQSGTSLPL